tara:strand:- start:279 stop:767 length:489 start_codon:yes stop_codon:yes gene_type:complete
MKNLEEAFEILADRLDRELSLKLINQDHKHTGRLLESIEFEIIKTFNGIALQESHLNYGRAMDQGVPANKVKISAEMINNLTRWVRFRNFKRSKNQTWKSVAFNVAKKMKRVGINPKKTKQGWLTNTLKEQNDFIIKTLTEAAEKDILITIDNMITQTKKAA